MTQEDKEILLEDLSSRLLYRVKVLLDGEDTEILNLIEWDERVPDCKPYLRSLSSMTEEEKEELCQEQFKDEQLFTDCILNHPEMKDLIIPHFALDWCNKKMFDWRGLIPKGLALEAPEGMYKTK